MKTKTATVVLAVAVFVIAASMPLSVSADEVHLKNGLVITGKVTLTRQTVTVERPGGTVTLDRENVKEVKETKTPEDIYDEKFKALKEKDASGHITLADWCRDNAMPARENELLETVLKFDPDNAKARDRLGYIRAEEGKWVLEEPYYQSKGFIKFRGEWMKPAARVEIIKAEEEKAKELAKATEEKKDKKARARYREYMGLSYTSDDKPSKHGQGYTWSPPSGYPYGYYYPYYPYSYSYRYLYSGYPYYRHYKHGYPHKGSPKYKHPVKMQPVLKPVPQSGYQRISAPYVDRTKGQTSPRK